MPKCGSCGAFIRWVATPGGKRMPLDNDPDPGGNVAVGPDGTVRVLKAGETQPDGTVLFRSHFATCPFAAAHRKRG